MSNTANETTENSERSQVSTEERHAMIAIHAYFLAEKRDFEQGSDWDYWLEAEREIDAFLDKSK